MSRNENEASSENGGILEPCHGCLCLWDGVKAPGGIFVSSLGENKQVQKAVQIGDQITQ